MKIEASGYVGLLLVIFGRRDAIDIPGLKEVLDEVLSSLTPQEQRVLQLRFGIESGVPLTYESIAREFGTTPDEVQSWEGIALRKLRHPSRSRRLKPFLDAIVGKS